MERDLDDASVSDDQDVSMRVPVENFVQCRDDAGFEARGAFSAGHDVPIRLLAPPRPGIRETLGDLLSAQTLPVAQVDLSEARRGLRHEVDECANRFCGLEGALQVARVEARRPATGEPAAEELGLAATLVGEGRIQLTLDPVFTIPGRLAVANQDHPGRRSRARWDGFAGLGRLRARGSDLDIYTNFLLIPPIGLGRSQESCSCNRTAHWPTFPFDRFWSLLRVSAPRVPLPSAMGTDSRPPSTFCSVIFSTRRATARPAMTRWSTPFTGPRAISNSTQKRSSRPTSRSRPASRSWSRPQNQRPRRRALPNRTTSQRTNPSRSRGRKHGPSVKIMLNRRGRWKHPSQDVA